MVPRNSQLCGVVPPIVVDQLWGFRGSAPWWAGSRSGVLKCYLLLILEFSSVQCSDVPFVHLRLPRFWAASAWLCRWTSWRRCPFARFSCLHLCRRSWGRSTPKLAWGRQQDPKPRPWSPRFSASAWLGVGTDLWFEWNGIWKLEIVKVWGFGLWFAVWGFWLAWGVDALAFGLGLLPPIKREFSIGLSWVIRSHHRASIDRP